MVRKLATRPLGRAVMDRTELMKASYPLQEICYQVSIYPVAPRTENTFSNREFEPAT
jgi:hypothetical protein